MTKDPAYRLRADGLDLERLEESRLGLDALSGDLAVGHLWFGLAERKAAILGYDVRSRMLGDSKAAMKTAAGGPSPAAQPQLGDTPQIKRRKNLASNELKCEETIDCHRQSQDQHQS